MRWRLRSTAAAAASRAMSTARSAVRIVQGWVAEAGVAVRADGAARRSPGRANFLSGHYGFAHLYGRGTLDAESVTRGLGDTWKLAERRLQEVPELRRHAGRDRARARPGVGAGPAAERTSAAPWFACRPMRIELVGHAFRIGANPRVDAQFNAGVLRGQRDRSRSASLLRHFAPSQVHDAAVREMIGRIDVIADETMNARGHAAVDLERDHHRRAHASAPARHPARLPWRRAGRRAAPRAVQRLPGLCAACAAGRTDAAAARCHRARGCARRCASAGGVVGGAALGLSTARRGRTAGVPPRRVCRRARGVELACPQPHFAVRHAQLDSGTDRHLRRRLRHADPGLARPALRARRPHALRSAPVAAAGGVSYRDDVRPILDNRCVVCHGCYDAPCQLKLGSWEGIARGTSKAPVYDASRLREAPPTRLFVDAQLPSQWRSKGFDPVLNERTPSPENNLAASVLYRSLALKQAHPLPDVKVLPASLRLLARPLAVVPAAWASSTPTSASTRWPACPTGCAGSTSASTGVLTRWLAAGSPGDAPLPPSAAVARQVQAWEQFLNGDSRKEQLMSRYLYEHLFLGHLVFEGDAANNVFRIVRSTTRTGRAGRARGDAPAVRRPRRGARVLPAGARARDPARQDAHALPAVAGAHGQVPRLVPRGRLPRRRAAVVRRWSRRRTRSSASPRSRPTRAIASCSTKPSSSS